MDDANLVITERMKTVAAENTATWNTWSKLLKKLPPGQNQITVAEVVTSLKTNRFIVKTDTGEYFLLAETVFDPAISKYDVEEGWKFEINVGPQSQVINGRVLIKTI